MVKKSNKKTTIKKTHTQNTHRNPIKKTKKKLTLKKNPARSSHKTSIKKHKKKSTLKKSHAQSTHRNPIKTASSTKKPDEPNETGGKILDEYKFNSLNMPITIKVRTVPGEYVNIYEVNISSISKTTLVVLEKIRKELISEVNLGMVDLRDMKKEGLVEEKFADTIKLLIKKYFPDIEEDKKEFLTTYLIQKSLGLGNIEILNSDEQLEEIVINSAHDKVWVYHRTHGWLKTNVMVESEEKIKHYASMIARKVGRQITILEPLLDANLGEGDRVNATLSPISTMGNTITLRKFSRNPLTIAHFIEKGTLSASAAALVWQGIQYEMSALIAGGTASGKTSMLNVLACFFPPNQRIISIEDTRELRLPQYLHWLPMSTRQPNPEGKGAITMEDLLVNSLRQRPDRILVGEIRRSREAETLFEAIHTGHSCYATFHANDVRETLNRLTHSPINVPETMLPAISMVLIQFRNRRTGLRRTFQIAEICKDSSMNVLKQYDAKKDILVDINKSTTLMEDLTLYTGHSRKELVRDIKEKETILKYMVKNKVRDVDSVGKIVADYYTRPELVRKLIKNIK